MPLLSLFHGPITGRDDLAFAGNTLRRHLLV